MESKGLSSGEPVRYIALKSSIGNAAFVRSSGGRPSRLADRSAVQFRR